MREGVGFFFFSSRRRHTRFDCDWSSDVCSSDLLLVAYAGDGDPRFLLTITAGGTTVQYRLSGVGSAPIDRSEEHTSELQSQSNLVCRLLLEKKKIYNTGPRTAQHMLLAYRFPWV